MNKEEMINILNYHGIDVLYEVFQDIISDNYADGYNTGYDEGWNAYYDMLEGEE